jgi:Zn-dependent protease
VEQIVSGLLAAGIIILLCFPIHEFSHAWSAYMLGDSTARWQGRLTLDPRAHFDPLGGLILVLSTVLSPFIIGWAKPTPVNPYNLRLGRRGEALVAASGPVSNLLMAAVVAVPVRLVWSDAALLQAAQSSLVGGLIFNVAFMIVVINALLFLFNLLPIPPLDGWQVVRGLVGARLAYQMRQVEQYGFVLLIALIVLGGRVLGPLFGGLVSLFVGEARLLNLAGL